MVFVIREFKLLAVAEQPTCTGAACRRRFKEPRHHCCPDGRAAADRASNTHASQLSLEHRVPALQTGSSRRAWPACGSGACPDWPAGRG